MLTSASSLVVLWPVSRQIDILREPGAISVGQRQVRSSTAIGPIRLEGWLHRPAITEIGPLRLRAHLNRVWVGPHLSSPEQTKATDVYALASYTASLGASLRPSPDASGSIDRRENCYIRAQWI
jgi:hypothetical protein